MGNLKFSRGPQLLIRELIADCSIRNLKETSRQMRPEAEGQRGIFRVSRSQSFEYLIVFTEK